ncbi:hypothetical protein ACLMJK_008434 [Lecanora helva]
MRYLNWDVLVFPGTGDTKTPLQEFNTSCTVIQDPGEAYITLFSNYQADKFSALDNATVPVPGNPSCFKTVAHPLPLVTCFVPSLLPDTPLRVSLHSWATPAASRATQSMAAQGNSVWFEAKVLIDGECTAGILFSQESSWPQIIGNADESYSVDKNKKHEQICFPPFHQELLTQVWTNPAQGLGTVRIVIAEGVNQGSAGNAVFAKLRNIVAFSFQHAPLHILENCGIAWPNPGMWWQAQQRFHHFSSPGQHPPDPDAHAHSPRRRQASKSTSDAAFDQNKARSHAPQDLSAHPALRASGLHAVDPFWSQSGPVLDAFTGNAPFNHFYKTYVPGQSCATSTSHDISMPDYSRPLSPTSSRSYPAPEGSRPPTRSGSGQTFGLSNAAVNDPGFRRLDSILQAHQEHNTESQFEDMISVMSPRKNSHLSGVSAPSNTRVNSVNNTPTINPNGPSPAAQDRAASYASHPRSVPVTTRDPPPPADASSTPALTLPNVNNQTAETKPTSGTVVKRKPIGRPKGRKEGLPIEVVDDDDSAGKVQRRATTGAMGSKENELSKIEDFSDGKGKRIADNAGSKVHLEGRLAGRNDLSPSENRFSKTGHKRMASKEIGEDWSPNTKICPSRSPLGEIENRL